MQHNYDLDLDSIQEYLRCCTFKKSLKNSIKLIPVKIDHKELDYDINEKKTTVKQFK